jgi:uncharacterized membrane protein
MARSATPARSSAARRAKPPTGGGGKPKPARPPHGAKTATRAAKSAGKSAKTVGKSTKSAAKSVTGSGPSLPTPNPIVKKVAKTAAKKAAKAMVRKTVEMGTNAVRRAADRAGEVGRSAVESGTNRLLPIQLSIDVAVPIHVAWEEWRSCGWLPEGVHRIVDVERDGDALIGHTAGPREVDWEAEIKDEREDESFAWLSVEGTDVAGLATFHQLSERLTRIELDLDVVPTNPSEAMMLALHVAHRRAEADLRRFKAHVEFINPDVYENGSGQGNEDDHRGESGSGNGRRGKSSTRNQKQRLASE